MTRFLLVALLLGVVAVVPLPARGQGAPAQASLSGVVLDLAGAPLAGARVLVRRDGAVEEEGVTVVTDERGGFTLPRLPAGRYRIAVSSPRWVPIVTVLEVPAAAGGPLRLQFRTLSLSDEVTVSATHTARDTLRVPGEVSVVERDAFDKAQARSFDDVLRYEPGIEMGATRRLLQTPTIRGFGSSRVLVVRDGARVSQFTSGHKGALFLDVNDVERVEVVRGPASALYGSGALGGVLSISSPDPGDLLRSGQSVGGSLAINYSGAYDELTLNPRAYGGTADGLGFALGYTGRRNDGLVDIAGESTRLDAAEEDVDAYDARLTAPVGRGGSFRLSFNGFHQDGNSSINLDSQVVGPEELVQRTTGQQTLTATYDLRGGAWWGQALRANASYTGMDLDEARPADGRVDAIDFRTVGVEVRNTAAPGSHQQITYGFELFRDREGSARDGEVNGLFPPGSQTQAGLYVQDEINLFAGRMTVVPGLRWDRWASDGDDTGLADRADRRLNPKLGATVEIVPGVVASASYAEGFRAPNFQELFISGTHFRVPLGPGMTLLGLFAPNADLDPETSRNVDAGLRFRRGGVSGRAAYYRAWVDDFIDLEVAEGFIPPGTVLFTFTNENVDEAQMEGFEASLRWDIDAHWSLRANHSSPRGEDVASGDALASIPPDKTVLGAEFRAAGPEAVLGLNARVVADHDRVPDGVEPSEGYTLVDLYTAWTPSFLPDVTLRFNIDNLADRQYEVPLFGTPGTGRDVRVGVIVRLGR